MIYRITGDGRLRGLGDGNVRAVDESGPANSAVTASTVVAFDASAAPGAIASITATVALALSLAVSPIAEAAITAEASPVTFAVEAPAAGVAEASGDAALTFNNAATLSLMGGASTSFAFETSASLSGMANATADASLAFTTQAAPQGLSPATGAASLAFTASATPAGIADLTSLLSIDFAASGQPSGIGSLAATAAITWDATASPTAVARSSSNSNLVFGLAAAPSALVATSGATSLTYTTSASPAALVRVSAATSFAFAASANPSISQSAFFRQKWLDVYAARQIVLNAIDANNRLIAKRADAASVANASAIVATNTRLDTTDGNLLAEANRITSLTGRVTVTESGLTTQGSALNALTTRVTSAEGVNTSQSSSITALDSRITSAEGVNTNQASALSSLDTRVSSTESTNTAQASSITSLGARVTDAESNIGSQGSALTALTTRVTDAEGVNTAQANSLTTLDSRITSAEGVNTAQASALTGLDTRVTSTESTNSAQATEITSLKATVDDPTTGVAATATAVTSLRTTATTSPNLVANSTFKANVQGWGVGVNSSGDTQWSGLTRSLAGLNGMIPLINNVGATHPLSPSGTTYGAMSDAFAVVAGRHYGAQMLLAQHRLANVYGILEFYDAAGAVVGSQLLYRRDANGNAIEWQIGTGFSGGTNRSGWAYVWSIAVAPVGAVQARLLFQCATNGGANPYMWMCEPMVELVSADRTFVSPYSPGGAEALASYSLTLDVNGYVTGWQFNNNGTIGDFTIRADRFAIVAPGAASYVPFEVVGGITYIKNAVIQTVGVTKLTTGTLNADMNVGTGRIIFDNGTFMKASGIGFGTSNQFLEWAGPSRALNLCDEASAVQYLKTNGSAYFGGTLSAGVFKNAVTSSAVSTTAQVETGTFGTNGGAKTVVCSFNYNHIGRTNANNTDGSTSATVVLERSYAGGAWTQIGSISATGTYTSTYDGEFNNYMFNANCAGSITVTDNQAGTGDFNYRARITANAGLWPYTSNSGSIGTQRLAIISTEG